MAVQGLTVVRAQTPHTYAMEDYWMIIESLKKGRRHPKTKFGGN